MNNIKLNQIPLKTLPVFITVAKHMSFSKAAAELCVTHSAVSQNIKQLEAYLNVILFKRLHRSIELTQAGIRLLKEVSGGLNMIYEAIEKEKTLNEKISLVVNIPSTLTSKCIIPELYKFQSRHPEIALQLSSHNRGIDFERENVDAGISYEAEPSSPYFEKLIADEIVLIVHPDFKDAPLQDLYKTQKIIKVDSPLRHNDWNYFCKANGLSLSDRKNKLIVQTTLQAIEAVINKVGIFVTHKIFIKNDLIAKKLDIVPAKTCLNPRSYFFVCNDNSLDKPKIKNSYFFIKDTLQNLSY